MKVFIAGPRAEKDLDEKIHEKLNNICEKKYEIFLGDAYGIDSLVQNFLNKKQYNNVKIFASNGVARNNYGKWNVENVGVGNNIKGFDFYAQKDIEMAIQADIGFMIWNGKSRGTFNNIVNLLNYNKEVVLYYVVNKKFYHLKDFDDFEKFLNNNVKLSSKLMKILPQREKNNFSQMMLF